MAEPFACRIDPDEEREFLEHCNMEWPRLGTTSLVPLCADFTMFTSYVKYVDHFAQRHRSYKLIYECSICQKRIGKRNKRHHKKTAY